MSSTRLPESPATTVSGLPWSLAVRLTAWYAGSSFVLILAATGFLYWVLASNLDREDDEFLADKVRILRALLRDRPGDAVALKQEMEWEWNVSEHARFAMRIVNEDGQVVFESPGMSALLPPTVFPAAATSAAEPQPGADLHTRAGRAFRVVAARAAAGDSGRETRILQVALDRSSEEQLLARYRRNLWLVLGLAVVVCTLAGYRIARRGLRPIQEVSETARRIRATTLDERIDVRGLPGELWLLAGTFNDMLDRLEEAFQRLSRFSADIAHELRTPVNNLRGEIEVALTNPRPAEEYREVLGSSLEECARLAGLIDSLLFLARAESPEAEIQKIQLDVGRELATVRDYYEASAAEAGVSLAVTAPTGLVALLDRSLFQRAVGNLLANALAHSSPGGRITLAGDRENGAVCIDVADTGSGIPPDHLPHVFDRFYRADQARTTSAGRVGLGLAIVHSIMDLHRGSVAIRSEVGKGTTVTLRFP